MHYAIYGTIIGISLYTYYACMGAIEQRNACSAWHEHTGQQVWWLNEQCLRINGNQLEAVPLPETLSTPRQIDLSEIQSVRYPYGKCSPREYYHGQWWPGECDATFEEPDFTLAPVIGG